MSKKTLISVILILVIALGSLFYLRIARQGAAKPVILGSSGSLIKFNIDDKIKTAELIMIGEVTETLPSQWIGDSGSDPQNASPEDVFRARGLFTDSLVSISRVLKGDIGTPIVRVRTFTGQTQKVLWTNESEPSYVVGKMYLLFLTKDTGATANIDPGDYIAVGAFQGVYEIVEAKAISKVDEWVDDEWALDELIFYIEKSLSADSPLLTTPTLASTEPVVETTLNENIPGTSEVKEIIATIARSYKIEREAYYTGDFSKFPRVFINDPRFNLDQYTLQTVRELTYNPSLESAGWLDYKMAYWTWGVKGALHAEMLSATAKAENRGLTQEERASLVDQYGRSAPPRPPREKTENEKIQLEFISVNVNGDLATAAFDEGPRTIELTLIFIEKNWYIVASETLSVHP